MVIVAIHFLQPPIHHRLFSIPINLYLKASIIGFIDFSCFKDRHQIIEIAQGLCNSTLVPPLALLATIISICT